MNAIVLSGGGAKGSYQIGAWKALRKLKYKYKIVTGTSIGALNGIFLVQNSYFKALWIWKNISMEKIFNKKYYGTNKKKDVFRFYGKEFIKNKGLNPIGLEKIIDKSLNKSIFFNSKIKYGLVTYNKTKKQPLTLKKDKLSNNNIKDYLIASASCYPAFKSKNIQGDEFIDGGYYDNLPINLAIEMGATNIIAVDLKAPGRKKITNNNIKIKTISPRNNLDSFLYFSKETSIKNMKYGYNDTLKEFGYLEGNKYTFKLNTINKINNKYKNTLNHIINLLTKSDLQKELMKKTLKLDNTKDDIIKNKLLLIIIEKLLSHYKVDDTKIYNYKNINKILKNNIIKDIKSNKKTILTKILKTLKENNYEEARKYLISNPIILMQAIYLYTILED